MSVKESWSNEAQSLLDAGREDQPPSESRAALLKSLGLPHGAPPAPDSGQGGTSVPPNGSAPPPVGAPAATASKSGLVLKGLAYGLGGIVAVLVPFFLLGGEDDEAAPSAGQNQVLAPSGESDALERGAREQKAEDELAGAAPAAEEQAHTEEPLAGQTTETPKAEQVGSPKAGSAQSGLTLRDEIELMKEARSALSAGQLSRSQELLSRHERLFEEPQLTAEATMISVELLVRQGRVKEARARAAPLMKPGSPYRSRLNALLPPK